MQKSRPDHAPLVAAPAFCHTCGTLLKPIAVMGRNGVQCVRYECRNEKAGCSYRVESNVYLAGEIENVRPDGTTV